MRLAVLTLAVLLSGATPSWGFSQDMITAPPVAGTVPVTPLGPQEVLLELQVTGVSRLPAEIATVSVPITRFAATPAQARAAVAADTERLVARARKAGVLPGDIRVLPRYDSRIGFIGAEVDPLMGTDEDSAPAPARQMAAAVVEIVLRHPNRYPSLRDAIESVEAGVPGPVYALRDPARGEREAKADALRRARAEAEDYARQVGMRLGRLVRLSAREGTDNPAMQVIARMMNPDASSDTVETRLSVAVDYALIPNS